MKNTLAPSVVKIDHTHPKGRKFTAIVTDQYDKAGLDEEDGQRVNDYALAELSTIVADFIARARLPINLVPWKLFYKEDFGIDVDLTKLVIPLRQKGFDRLLVIAAGLTIEQVFQKCRERFGAWKYTDTNLDKAVPTNDRVAIATYAIWVRDRVEADEEHKNQSADALAQAKIQGITLLERFIYELKYFKETGKHLDIKNVTLCNGSRSSGGGVPFVGWRGGKLYVRWYDPDDAVVRLRSRAVVS